MRIFTNAFYTVVYLIRTRPRKRTVPVPKDYVSSLERKVMERNVEVVLLGVCCWLLIAVSLYARHRVNEARAIIQTYEETNHILSSDPTGVVGR